MDSIQFFNNYVLLGVIILLVITGISILVLLSVKGDALRLEGSSKKLTKELLNKIEQKAVSHYIQEQGFKRVLKTTAGLSPSGGAGRISKWDVPNSTSVDAAMLSGMSNFNQPVSNWGLSSITDHGSSSTGSPSHSSCSSSSSSSSDSSSSDSSSSSSSSCD